MGVVPLDARTWTAKAGAAVVPTVTGPKGALTSRKTSGAATAVKEETWVTVPSEASSPTSPAACGVTVDETRPSASLTRTQGVAEQPEKLAVPLVSDKVTLLPVIGVAPFEAST
jgi:hypothetical protein